MPLKVGHQLPEQQLSHGKSLRITLITFMLKLAYHLSDLAHANATESPVRVPRRTIKSGDRPLPVNIQRQPLRAVDDILQHKVVNGSVGVFIFGANVKQIATGYPVRAIVQDMQAITAPDQNQLAKLMGMLSKDILRITIGYGDSLLLMRKKV